MFHKFTLHKTSRRVLCDLKLSYIPTQRRQELNEVKLLPLVSEDLSITLFNINQNHNPAKPTTTHNMACFTALPYEIQHQILSYLLPVDLCRYNAIGRYPLERPPIDTFTTQAISIHQACPFLKDFIVEICLQCLRQREADYNKLFTKHLHMRNDHHNGPGDRQCCSLHYWGSTYAMDEFYLEGGSKSSAAILWEHYSSNLTPCRELERMEAEDNAQMGYPEQSCLKLSRLLLMLNNWEWGALYGEIGI